MELNRVKKLGSFLEFILKIGMVMGVVLLISFYWIIKEFQIEMNSFLIMIYPGGICFLALVYQFIELFGLLRINKSFSKKTIIYLKRGMYISFIISFLVLIAFILLFFYEIYTLGIKLCVSFIGILFFGVGVALYILAELFKEALDYKEENELTI